MPVRTIADLPDGVIGFAAHGTVTADDYTSTIDPAVAEALTSRESVRLLYVLREDFAGWSGGALWEDGKLGMSHIGSWEMIAVVTDHDWIRHTVNLFGHLMPGRVQVFELADEDAARTWLAS